MQRALGVMAASNSATNLVRARPKPSAAEASRPVAVHAEDDYDDDQEVTQLHLPSQRLPMGVVAPPPQSGFVGADVSERLHADTETAPRTAAAPQLQRSGALPVHVAQVPVKIKSLPSRSPAGIAKAEIFIFLASFVMTLCALLCALFGH